MDPDEALRGESPQDAVFRLRPGTIERIACNPVELAVNL
jgi:hypothetical protein